LSVNNNTLERVTCEYDVPDAQWRVLCDFLVSRYATSRDVIAATNRGRKPPCSARAVLYDDFPPPRFGNVDCLDMLQCEATTRVTARAARARGKVLLQDLLAGRALAPVAGDV